MATESNVNRYWDQTLDALLKRYESQAMGLATSAIEPRLQRYGANTLKARRADTRLSLFLSQFRSPIVLILIFATIASAFLGDWIDAGIISLIVLGSALLSFVQEYSAGNATAKLLQQVQITATVLRDGQPTEVTTDGIVPGDVILLSAGSLIPADAILLEAKDLFVNQAILTGETFPVEKTPGIVTADGLSERTNTVFRGTSVGSGTAKALVVQTGKMTAFGQIAARLELRPPQTEFERGVRHLGFLLTQVMFVLVIVILALNVYFNKPVLDSLLFSVALAVGLTPQLLPAIININLSKGSQRMAQEGVIVRRLNAIENFGSMDVLCTDKTGTLTKGIVQLDGALDVEGNPSDAVFLAAYLNAQFQSGLQNPLDKAVLASRTLDTHAVTKLDETPYDFVRKRLSIVVAEPTGVRIITKGALANILEVCSTVMLPDSGGQALDRRQQDAIQTRFAGWSAQGYRVLGIAVKPVTNAQTAFSRDDEKDMTFLGFLLFLDPPKPDVRQTILDLENLGVTLKIITGDNKLVALHAAETIAPSFEVI